MESKLYQTGYETPVVEIIHVEVEQGFASSNPAGGINDLESEPWQ